MSTKTTDNNKRIAKNTLFLYFRMMFIILVSLYTSRVILKTLGVEDYGIYNVVGGFVSMFGFLNTAMSATTQRYITYSLGTENTAQLNKVFSNCVMTHILIALIVLLFAESVGLWFLFNKMIIPESRMTAAFVVFQCSVVSTVVLILSVPYNADIIAHEKMSAFAYISIVEVTLKLLVVCLLKFGGIDKLIFYGILLLIVQCSIRLIYGSYCKRHFEETKFRIIWDFSLFKEMLSFAGWNLWGGVSNIMYTHGVNLLLNLFFGPAVNAARGIAIQVQNAISQFANSFQMAINPQITKSYAQGDNAYMHKLVFRSSKFTFILLFILSLPIFTETDYILRLWLGTVPNWTVVFLRLMLCIVIVDSVANPFMVSVAATGNVKLYQAVIGGTMLLIVPTSYVFLKLGGAPSVVFVTHLVFVVFTFILRLFIVKRMIHFSIKEYCIVCVLKIIAIIVPSFFSVWILKRYLNEYFGSQILIIVSSAVIGVIFSLICGLTKSERQIILQKVCLKKIDII